MTQQHPATMSMVDVVDVDDSSLKLSKNRVQCDLMFFAVYFFSWDFPANMTRSQVEMLYIILYNYVVSCHYIIVQLFSMTCLFPCDFPRFFPLWFSDGRPLRRWISAALVVLRPGPQGPWSGGNVSVVSPARTPGTMVCMKIRGGTWRISCHLETG